MNLKIILASSSRWHSEGIGTNGIWKKSEVKLRTLLDPRCLNSLVLIAGMTQL